MRPLSRRRFLHQSFRTIGLTALVTACTEGPGDKPPTPAQPTFRPIRLSPIESDPSAPASTQFSEWSRHARLANATFGEDPEAEELQEIVANLRNEKVSVVETDTQLSDWLTDAQFEDALNDIRSFNRAVHAGGMKVVWYYPSLEVISIGGQHGPSFYKTSPSWAQIGIDGQVNVFYGGVVFWVELGDESVWLSPNGPWRDYYLNRVKAIAQSGADGLWPDVPLYFGYAPWCDMSTWGKAAFTQDTGLDPPPTEDWTSPTWRRWVEWRHRNLNDFLIAMAAAGRSVNPQFETFVETVTMDYYDAQTLGLDGAYLRLAQGVTHVWEVDVVSNDTGMRYATEDDWICLISMYKYARAASGQKPAWAFSYGIAEDDAIQVMAEAIAAGCNPYEVKSPEKTAGVSAAMRTRMYSFVEANTERIFDATPLAKVVLYHSTPSRDYVRPSEGTGLFASTERPPQANEWWSNEPHNSCYEKQWLSEYRGMLKTLVHNHIPFNVLTSPTFQQADLDGYSVLLLPNVEALSDSEANAIRRFVQDGGTLIATGPNPTGLNEFGDTRADYALADVLGISRGQPLPAGRTSNFGSGAAYYFSDLPGRSYLRESTPAAATRLMGPILEKAPPVLTTSAVRQVHVEATQLPGEVILQFTNLVGVAGTAQVFRVVPTRFEVAAQPPSSGSVAGVYVTSPDYPTPDLQPLPYTVEGSEVHFTLELAQYAMVVIKSAQAAE